MLVREGGNAMELVAARVPIEGSTHGTGCILSSAIATYLALGHSLHEAASLGKEYLRRKLLLPRSLGRGAKVLV